MPSPKKAVEKAAPRKVMSRKSGAPPGAGQVGPGSVKAATPPASSSAKGTSTEQRAARDPYRGPGPSTKQIEQSFSKGKTVTLDAFRGIIDWS